MHPWRSQVETHWFWCEVKHFVVGVLFCVSNCWMGSFIYLSLFRPQISLILFLSHSISYLFIALVNINIQPVIRSIETNRFALNISRNLQFIHMFFNYYDYFTTFKNVGWRKHISSSKTYVTSCCQHKYTAKTHTDAIRVANRTFTHLHT